MTLLLSLFSIGQGQVQASLSCQVGCLLCLADSQQGCILCDVNRKYIPNASGQCGLGPTPHCSEINSEGKCSSCQPTYILSNGVCQRDYSGCLILLPFGKGCSQCVPEMMLDTVTSTCKGTLNTINYQGPCKAGFQTDTNGKCTDNTGNCLVIPTVDTMGTCILCKKGYSLNGFTCSISATFPPYCYVANDKGNCLVCWNKWTLSNGVCKPPSDYVPLVSSPAIGVPSQGVDETPNNCQVLDSVSATCGICNPSYSTNANGICTQGLSAS